MLKWWALGLVLLTACGSPPTRELTGRVPLKNPIVLVHGATTKGSRLQIGFLDFGEYFRGIEKFYKATGTQVYVAELSTDASIGERATVLKSILETDFKGRKVNLIGHSLGGLDIRYAAGVLKAAQIASITTIGTPHRGTPMADWAVRQGVQESGWYWLFRLLGYNLKERRFLKEISTEFMRDTFNPKVPDLKGVQYFSVASKASFADGTMSYLMWLTTHWLEEEHSPLAANGHDGLVPIDSQRWGTEIYRTTLDHLGQMNHHELRKSQEEEAYKVYTEIYDNLAGHGL